MVSKIKNIYLTESITNPMAPSPRIIANTWLEAEELCLPGYKVIGRLIEEIDCDEAVADYYQHKLN